VRRVVIFGNSGSGKSTLAKKLCQTNGLSHLDLDLIAWLPTTPVQRKPIDESKQAIDAFITAHSSWVIEGCYSDLLELALPEATEIIFLNLPVDLCIVNAKQRPWEPQKYESKAAQDENLAMLIDWIAQYPIRKDVFSQASHEALFASFQGKKTQFTCNRHL